MGQNTIMTSIRLDRQLHEQLRRIAFEKHVSLHSLLIEGARAMADRPGTGEIASRADGHGPARAEPTRLQE